MAKDNLLSLITNASNVVISLLGKTFNIKSWANGTYSIEDKDANDFESFNSADELIDNYMIMNMPLVSLTSWICVTSVA